MELSLVFPCYREEGHVEQNVDRVVRLMSLLSLEHEIVLVNDHSPDRTGEIIEKLVAKHPGVVRAISHSENRGRGAAFMTGFSASAGRYVGFFDIDCEIGPSYIFECLAKLRDGADLVIGKRVYRVHFRLLYRHVLSSLYAQAVVLFLGLPRGLDTESGYKFFRRETLAQYQDRFQHYGWFWDTEVVSRFIWDGHTVVPIPCVFVRNYETLSTVNIVKDSVSHLMNLVRFRRTRREL